MGSSRRFKEIEVGCMNEAVYLDSLFDAETEYWDDYWHNPDFRRTKDVDIPDWLEEEQ